MHPEDCIFYQMAKAAQMGSKFWTRHVSGFKVTAVQAMVISFLSEQDGGTATDLGKRTMLDSATLTGILDRLENAGILERRPHPDDRRAICIHLTADGKALAKKLHRTAEAANQDFLNPLTAEEQKSLRELLVKIRNRPATATP